MVAHNDKNIEAVDMDRQRHFLFLQGPHGPFLNRLGKMLRRAGADVTRVGFNAGDQFFWRDKASYIPFTKPLEEWSAALIDILESNGITDILLYGDTRPIHAQAVEIAKDRGIRVHVLEEGYLRPYWATYERDGSNGNSRLGDMSIDQMREALEMCDPDAPIPSGSHWGEMREHVFYGALYHWFVMFANRKYRQVQRHRELPVATELKLYLGRLFFMPLHAIDRILATWRIRFGGYPYHLALLQLEHDESFRKHSPFERMEEFLALIIEGFAKGAPSHHHLVIKAHPLETGRRPLSKMIKALTLENGIKDRIHYVRGGKLAKTLNDARSAVTINSTAGQQVLWRGIPLKILGTSVYDKPELVSQQSIEAFFTGPMRPDMRAYKDYRRFLLETSQIPGGFYSSKGRRQLLRHLTDMVLAESDPYDALKTGQSAPRRQLKVVS